AVRGRTPLGRSSRLPRVVEIREAGVGGGPGRQFGGGVGGGLGASGRLGGVGGGVQCVGGGEFAGQRGGQGGSAAELGRQGLPVPRGALIGLFGMAQFGLAPVGQLREALVRDDDRLVQVFQGRLRVGQPGGGQPGRFGRQFRSGRGEQARFGFHGEQV